MNVGPTRIIAAVAIGTAVWLGKGKAPVDEPLPAKESSVTKPPAKRPERGLYEAQALTRFRALSAYTTDNAPTFRRVQTLAGNLPTDQLVALIDEFDGSMHEGIDGWRRAALWAELGKRDPNRGEALLRSRFPPVAAPANPDDPFSESEGNAPSTEIANFPARRKSFEGYIEEANLAAFAYFRGRLEAWDFSPSSLERLIADFGDMDSTVSNEGWSSRVDEILFRTLARHDPEFAWNLLPGPKRDSPLAQPRKFFTYDAYQGFFDGLDTRKEGQLYVSRWQPFWESEAVRANYTTDGRESEQWDYRAYGIAGMAASTLARFDREAAARWAEKCPYFTLSDRASIRPREAGAAPDAFPEVHRSLVPPVVEKP